MTVVLFVIVGIVAGILSGLFGIGGGVVVVPALVLVAGMPLLTATGTSLGALLLPVGLLGAYQYYKSGNLNVAAALWVAVGIVAGVWLGARLAHRLSGTELQRAFAVFLLVVAVRLWWTAGAS
jgi:uncharacterized protein